MRLTKACAAFLCFCLALSAQVPDPAPPQAKPIALVGGTAHIGDGTLIENAVVTFDQGKITAVANLDNIRINRTTHEIIDTTGKHIYPGFILASGILGLTEVESVRATIDTEEVGQLNPNVRSIIAYNTDSELIPTWRYNGILTTETCPEGGIISGQSSIVQLDAWNWEDAAVKTDTGLHINWPARKALRFDFATFSRTWQDNKHYEHEMLELEKIFSEAHSYTKLANSEANIKLAAMAGLFSGEKTLFIHADSARDMVEAVLFAEKHGVTRTVLVGAEEALTVADFLVKHKVPVILAELHRLPNTPEEDVDGPYKLPAQLQAAGVTFGISYTKLMSGRNLPFVAGTAAGFGLDREQALAAITGNIARILGIDDQVGTLKVGLDATLFISSGDALDMRTNNLEAAFIGGRHIELGGMQQRLYERYKKKYGQ